MTATATIHHLDQLAGWRAALQAPAGRVVLVNVPMSSFLMIDGRGELCDEPFDAAVRALAHLSAALRLYLQESDHSLLDPLPVEILWSPADDEVWREASAGEWSWTAMVAQPASVTRELLAAVTEHIADARPDLPLRRVRLGSLREGLCAQTAQCGTRERRQDVLARVIEQARQLGCEPHGPHHEIHLADLRHADAAPLRTVVRQPVHRVA